MVSSLSPSSLASPSSLHSSSDGSKTCLIRNKDKIRNKEETFFKLPSKTAYTCGRLRLLLVVIAFICIISLVWEELKQLLASLQYQKVILCLYKTFYDNGILYREVRHDRPEELASGNMCGTRPRRMVCLVMAIPKWNKTTKALLVYERF